MGTAATPAETIARRRTSCRQRSRTASRSRSEPGTNVQFVSFFKPILAPGRETEDSFQNSTSSLNSQFLKCTVY